MATSVVAAFLAVAPDPWEGAAAALACYGWAAELAAAGAAGPGTLQPRLFDELFRLTPQSASAGARIEVEAARA
ncbi:MAG: hydroxyethylthiazole kinase [Firmicutes bacterium]|nr:hydroxyethylthiazole kinase [Bacillota bacterium]